MNRWIGRWILGVALLHTLFAIVVFKNTLLEIAAAGVFNSVGQDPMRGAVVWFVLFGAVIALLGFTVDALEKAQITLPASVVIGMLLLALLGVVLMPESGFWLLFVPGLAALAKRRSA